MTKTTLTDMRNNAVSAHKSGDLEQAEALYREVVKFTPKDSAMWSNFGALYRTQKRYDLAALAQHRALQCADPTIGTLNNAANAFFDNGEVEKSLELRMQLQEMDPTNPKHWAFGAKCLRGLRRYDEAVDMAKQGLEIDNEEVELHLQLAFAELSLGDYQNGFRTYNWRWLGDEINEPDLPMQKWQGESLEGKTILAFPEQGFGDTIIMARFFPQLKELGCKVLVPVKAPLKRLFTNMYGIDQCNPPIDTLDQIDYWTPFMDMPLYLGTTIDTVPPPMQMHLPQDSIKRAKARVAPTKDQFNVGVLWSGSVTYRANHKRSFGHQQFMKFADMPGLQMFSLYKGPLLDGFLSDGSSTFIQNAGGEDRDFADSAALIKELDLVITMDSAIAHVAASLGVPTWNLLHDNPYWLYEPFEDHTPWYPSMRMVRQGMGETWHDVFKRVRLDLEPLVTAKIGAK